MKQHDLYRLKSKRNEIKEVTQRISMVYVRNERSIKKRFGLLN